MRIQTKAKKKKDVIKKLAREAEIHSACAADELADILNGRYKDDPSMQRDHLDYAVHDLLDAKAALLAIRAMLEES